MVGAFAALLLTMTALLSAMPTANGTVPVSVAGVADTPDGGKPTPA